ncbi:MAG: hypothetical protein MT490_03220 [Sphingomonas sp.]|uniref:hypothetical protein n=1 Tax=Sphingomonas sp. TaxID=28214 RepID=UPI002276F373|nr:hypothetical protein [Sphingomonas sp.]MCX8474787.1 hypothetical protein [Sphingomonas sp.]
MSSFSVARLSRDETDQAYALVRTFAPGISRELWNAYAASQFFRGGFLVLWGPGRTIFGLAGYRIEACERTVRVLLIEDYVTIELSASAPGRKLLAQAIEALAAEAGCGAIRQVVPFGSAADPAWGRLRNYMALTHVPLGVTLTKRAECRCAELRPLPPCEAGPSH